MLLICGVVIIAICLAYLLMQKPKYVTPKEDIDALTIQLFKTLSLCPTNENRKSYECMTPLIKSFLKEHKDRDRLFDSLSRMRIQNTNVSSLCHVIGHAIGHAFFEIEPNVQTAIDSCRPTCSDGCTMGVVEGLIGLNRDHISNSILIEKADSICLRIGTGSYVTPKQTRQMGECYHALGHGITVINSYDYERSLHYCNRLSQRGFMDCVFGVTMEFFQPNNLDKLPILNGNHFELCSKLSPNSFESGACYGMLTKLWEKRGLDHDTLLEHCGRLTPVSNRRPVLQDASVYITNQHPLNDRDMCYEQTGRLIASTYADGQKDMYFSKLKKVQGDDMDAFLYGSIYAIYERYRWLQKDYCLDAHEYISASACQQIFTYISTIR